MTDVVPPSPSPSASPSPPGPRSPLPMARVSRRRQFQLVWLIPIVALAIGGFLAWRAVSQRGPDITIQFETADGLVAGQTKVKHKSVELGSVTSITLSRDDSHVLVGLRMQREATSLLTENARFRVGDAAVRRLYLGGHLPAWRCGAQQLHRVGKPASRALG